ncbi:unnamed protein product [Microthlaspi erraticum]|uniref:Neprosin PEP catalytic domain-containing protein n=1 Tax=Microthlaspi erraticum TaxID=1685480 RepID=A0A6D2KC32_9BRAS|nr:unnamed protein product [Microthlaspi erraticum]
MRKAKTNNTGFGYLWENGVGCPIGTVPIRRVTKDDLLSLNSLDDDKYKPRGSWSTNFNDSNNPVHNDQYHYAVGRTNNTGIHYHGATMDLCITAPGVKPKQFSHSRLHIQLGNDYVQIGLAVNPVLYGDVLPRTFVYTHAGGKSCYNSHCDVGMILVRRDVPLGMPFKPVSIRGSSESHYVIFGLIKDQANGNWWLQLGDDAEEIGFWPAQRFPQSFGNKVEWGGEVFSANQPSPEMGYGFLPAASVVYDAYVKRIAILDDNFHFDQQVYHLEEFSDNIQGYGVIDSLEFKDPEEGHIIYFGGPGNI